MGKKEIKAIGRILKICETVLLAEVQKISPDYAQKNIQAFKSLLLKFIFEFYVVCSSVPQQWDMVFPRDKYHRISQNSRGWKGPLWVI